MWYGDAIPTSIPRVDELSMVPQGFGASQDGATTRATIKNKADMVNKKGWKMSSYVHILENKG